MFGPTPVATVPAVDTGTHREMALVCGEPIGELVKVT